MSNKVYVPWFRSSSSFVSVQSGAWNNPATWNIVGSNGSLYPTKGYCPEQGNDVFIEAAHAITCSQDQACKTLNLNATQDVVRIDTGLFKLSVWGQIKSYNGTYSSASFNSANAGIAGWINGTFKYTGSVSRTIMGSGQVLTANSRASGWIMEIDFPVGQVATVATSPMRCGFIVVTSGTLHITPNNVASNEIRVGGIDYTPSPGDLTNAGTVLIRSNGSLILNGRLVKHGVPASAKTGLQNLTVEAGGSFRWTLSGADSGAQTPVYSYSLLGSVYLIESFAQLFLNKGTYVGAVSIIDYAQLYLGGSGTKTLVNNVQINSLLSLSGTATVALNTFALTYATNANLEITTTRTRGSEIPLSGSGSSICKDLIIGAGVVYTTGGTVNIRGVVVLGAGASIVGTVNQNQP